MDTRTFLIFSIALILLLLIGLALTSEIFWRLSFGVAKQTVKLPVRQVRKYRNSRQEHAFTVDYKDGSSKPVKVWVKKGNNTSVQPKEVASAEVLIHTHPKATSGDKLEAAYANELRERPSAADLRHLQHGDRDFELVMTPSGELQRYEKLPVAEKRSFFGKLRSDLKLSRAEVKSQKQVLEGTEIRDTRDARQAASKSNKLFLEEARKQGFRVSKVKGDTVKTEIKD